MKKIIGFSLILFLAGCSSYEVEKVESFVKDPHYAQHQQALDEIEHQYLQKQISYIDYQEKKKELEENYDKEVKMREEKIHE